jgi:hypothetical protein
VGGAALERWVAKADLDCGELRSRVFGKERYFAYLKTK